MREVEIKISQRFMVKIGDDADDLSAVTEDCEINGFDADDLEDCGDGFEVEVLDVNVVL